MRLDNSFCTFIFGNDSAKIIQIGGDLPEIQSNVDRPFYISAVICLLPSGACVCACVCVDMTCKLAWAVLLLLLFY